MNKFLAVCFSISLICGIYVWIASNNGCYGISLLVVIMSVSSLILIFFADSIQDINKKYPY